MAAGRNVSPPPKRGMLPKTRSGKIMLLKQIASGMEIKGDMTMLEDFSKLAKLSSSEE